jgi:circadian clock protein KaiC
MIELSVIEERLRPGAPTTLLHPGEVDLNRVIKLLESEVELRKPRRLVLDSLAELRLMAQNPLRYRRQILALKSFFATRQVTVLFLDDGSADANDPQIESIAHGVIELEHLRPEYGAERRRLSVLKLRGVRFRGGFHDYTIQTGGLVVFPRLIAAEHRVDFRRECVSSGLETLDALLGGGVDRGTSTLFLGPAGSGKSTIALQFACAAAERGEKVAMFVFDENAGTLQARAQGLGLNLEEHVRSGAIAVKQVDPAELAPGEFAYLIRDLVLQSGVRLIVIDSLNGYLNAMPAERFLVIQLHELLTFLSQRGVTTLLVLAQHGLLGSQMQSPVDLTYLADTVVLLRYFEFAGAIKKAVSVIKKRSGGHESTIRELSMGAERGVHVGAPLDQFRGVLSGIPVYFGGIESMAEDGKGDRSR